MRNPEKDQNGNPLPTPSLAEDILNAIESLVCVVNGRGELVYVSPAVKRILGYEVQDVLGEGWWSRVYAGDAELGRLVRERLSGSARGETPILAGAHTAKAWGAKDDEHWIVWRDAKGPGDLLVGVGQDVTALHKAVERVEAQEMEFRAIFENATDGMLILNRDWVYEQANSAACKIFRRTKEEIIGKMQGTLHPANIDFGVLREKALRDGTARAEVSFAPGDAQDGDRDVRTLELAVATNVFADRHLMVLRDITERRRLQTQLEEAHRLEAVGKLAGGVAHDFNNMLTAIRGYAQLLQRHTTDERHLRYVEAILGATESAARTTRQLLAFSRKQMMAPKPTNLNQAITSTADLLHRVIGDDIELVILLAQDAGEVMLDMGQFSQVLMNLAVNSRDAMPDGGKLIIETRKVELGDEYVLRHVQVTPGAYSLIAITDTGMGIVPEILPHIFEPFFTTKEFGKGTGLGLATVYGTIKQSGGYIWVYSEPGQGTSFKIYLPRIGGPNQVRHHPAAKECTLLVIEDDEVLRKTTVEALAQDGYEVLQASDGAEALNVCQRFQGLIDLVLTDVNAYRMSGEDLMGYFAVKYPKMAVVHMSGFSQARIDESEATTPNALFLSKPFTLEQLRATMEKALAGKAKGADR